MATASPIIQRLRNFFAGRNFQVKLNNRYAPEQSPRTMPDPYLPGGPSHRLADNYYYSRDGRRESQPPTLVYSTIQRLPAPQTEEGGKPAEALMKKPVQPGSLPTWKLSTDEPYL